jgi:hypothetical protein
VMDFVDIFVEVFCVEESVDPIEKEIIWKSTDYETWWKFPNSGPGTKVDIWDSVFEADVKENNRNSIKIQKLKLI